MKYYLIIFALIPNLALAATQAECVTFAREFNRQSKGGILIGLETTGEPTFAVSKRDGYKAGMSEQAAVAKVMRACLSTSLGNWFYRVSGAKGLLCEVRDLDSLTGPCSDNYKSVKFKAFQ